MSGDKMRFELKEVKDLAGCNVLGWVCKNPIHNVKMSKEDANNRGISEKWVDDGTEGYVRVEAMAEIIKAEKSFTFPRVGKKAAVVNNVSYVLRCPSCAVSEIITFYGAGTSFAKKIDELRIV